MSQTSSAKKHALLDRAFAHGNQLAGSKPERPQAPEFQHRREEDRTPTQTAMNRTGNSAALPMIDPDTISAEPLHPAPLRSAKPPDNWPAAGSEPCHTKS